MTLYEWSVFKQSTVYYRVHRFRPAKYSSIKAAHRSFFTPHGRNNCINYFHVTTHSSVGCTRLHWRWLRLITDFREQSWINTLPEKANRAEVLTRSCPPIRGRTVQVLCFFHVLLLWGCSLSRSKHWRDLKPTHFALIFLSALQCEMLFCCYCCHCFCLCFAWKIFIFLPLMVLPTQHLLLRHLSTWLRYSLFTASSIHSKLGVFIHSFCTISLA